MVAINRGRSGGVDFASQAQVKGVLALGRALLSRIDRFLASRESGDGRGNVFETLEPRQMLSDAPIFLGPSEFTATAGTPLVLNLKDLFSDDVAVTKVDSTSAQNPLSGGTLIASEENIDSVYTLFPYDANGVVTLHLTAYDEESNFIEQDVSILVQATEGVIVEGYQEQVNSGSGTPVSPYSSTRMSDGRIIVVWSESSAVYGRIYGGDGVVFGSDIELVPDTSGAVYSSHVTALTGGGFAVAYSGETDGDGAGIFVQRFDEAGTAVGSVIPVNVDTTGYQNNPSVAGVASGGFVVAWETTDAGGYGVHARRFVPGTWEGGAEFQVNATATTMSQDHASVAGLADGGFVIAWGSQLTEAPFDNEVLAFVYNADGSERSSLLTLTTSIDGGQGFPVAAGLSTQGFAVAWSGETLEDTGATYVQFFDNDGVLITGHIANETTTGGQNTPAIAALDGDGVVVLWRGTGEGDTAGIFGRIFDATHNPASVEFRTNTYTTNVQSIQTVTAMGDNGAFFTAWRSQDESFVTSIQSQQFSFNEGPVASVIPPLAMFESDYFASVDVSKYFTDDHDPSQDLTYTIVSNSNPALFSATFDSDTVVKIQLNPLNYGVGDVVVRATDSHGAYTDGVIHVGVQGDSARYPVPLGPATITSVGSDNPWAPDVATAADGSYVVVWENQTGSKGIQGQRYAADGTPVGTVFDISTLSSAGFTRDAKVATAWDGSFVVVWWSEVAGSDEVFARRYDSAGAPLGDEFVVNTLTTSNQNHPAVAMSADGRFVVAWESDESDTILRGQMFDADGAKLGGEFVVSDALLTGPQVEVSLAMSSLDGSFVATWSLDQTSTTGDMGDIYARMFSGTGVGGSAFTVNSTTEDCQCEPVIAVAGDGTFIVLWENDGMDGTQIHGQIFDSTGTKVGSEFLASDDGGTDNSTPGVGMEASGAFTVTWVNQDDETNDQTVRAQRYTSDAFSIGDMVIVAGIEAETFTVGGAVGVAPSGNFAVTWYRQSTGEPVLNAVYSRSYALTYQPYVREEIPEQHFWVGEPGDFVDLHYIFGPNPYDLIFTVTDNTNPGLVTATVDSDLVDLELTPDMEGTAHITVKATALDGTWITAEFDVVVELLEATLTLPDTELSYSANLYDPELFEYFLEYGLFLASTGYSSGGVIDNFEMDFVLGGFSLTLTGHSGQGWIKLLGEQMCGCPVEGKLYIDITDTKAPVFEGFVAIPAVTRSAVGSVDVSFSEAIDVGSFDWESVTLTRDGGANLIDATSGSGLTFTLVNAALNRYRISGLSSLTNYIGEYVLTLVDGGVSDPAGIPMGTGGEISWLMRAAVPGVPTLSPASQGIPGSIYTPTTTPTVVGTATPGSTVEIYEGTTLLGSAAADEDGDYEVLLPTLTNGAHTIKARATDGMGGPTAYSADSTFHVFDHPPTMTAISTYVAPKVTPLTQPTVTLEIPANLSTFTWEDLVLTRDGGSNLATSAIVITQSLTDPLVYVITIPTSITQTQGVYSLTVNGTQVQSQAGWNYNNDRTTTWTQLAAIGNMSAYPTARVTPVTTPAIRFYTQINPATFTWQDIVLTRDGGANLATNAITITPSGTDPLVYVINIPASITQLGGNYDLTVLGAGITSVFGSTYANNGHTTWTQSPLVGNMSAYPTPRTTAVTSPAVRFYAPINAATFTWEDLLLTRDGGANIADNTITITQAPWDPMVYVINIPSGLTTPNGNYVLTVLGANIQTPEGVPFANNGQTTWSMQSPTTIASMSEYPVPRVSPPVTKPGIRFNVQIQLATFTWEDLILTRDGGANLATNEITIEASGWDPLVYVIVLPETITSITGTYDLTVLGAGILSSVGTPFSNNGHTTWQQV